MYSVLIVDDEYYVRSGIRNRIDWARLNLNLAGEMENGLSALEFLRDAPVDILLTDIRMPEMDGLQLIAAAKQLNPEIRCIILSGYDDFAYTRTAIRLGVSDYIQKPVDEDELAGTLQRVIAELDQGNRAAPPAPEADALLGRQLARQKGQRQLEQLFSGQEADFDATPDERLAVVVLCAAAVYEQDDIAEWANAQAVENVSVLSDVQQSALLRIRFLVSGQNLNEQALLPLARRLSAGLREKVGADAYAGFSNPVKSLRELPGAYREAMTALKSKLLYSESVLYPGMLKPQNMDELNAAVHTILELRDALSQRNKKNVQMLVVMLFTGGFSHIDTLQTILRYIGDIVSEYRMRYRVDGGELAGILADPDGLLAFDTLEHLRSALVPQILDFFFFNESFLDDRIVGQVQLYIRQHLSEDLKVSTLGQLFFLSPNHLSYLFKKETGYTLSDYVENARMERARALLSMACNTVLEVALQVGYSDAAYFSRVFKKATGLSPQKYQVEFKLVTN